MSCVIPLREALGSLPLVASRLCPRVPFPFANFALYPFMVINYSHADGHTLSPVSPPNKSLNLGVLSGLRDPQRTCRMFCHMLECRFPALTLKCCNVLVYESLTHTVEKQVCLTLLFFLFQ